MMGLTDIERFDKFWNPDDFENCLYYYIRDENDFGYQDINFQISSATSLGFCYSQLSKIDTEELCSLINNKTRLINNQFNLDISIENV